MRSLLLTGVLLTLLFHARPADACSCMGSGPPCQGYFQVDAVFAGTVRGITGAERSADPMPFSDRKVTFTVQRAFRGVEGVENTTLAVFTGMGGGDCGYAFKNGESYLVYAYRRGGQLITGICSRTKKLVDAAEDLRFIESLATAKPGARISGAIKHWDRDLSGDRSRQPEPMPFVHVRVSGPGGGQAETDEEGRYEITGLPPGKYRVEVFPPPNFSTEGRDVELRDARSCAVADFGVHFDGQISGVVRGRSGDPVGGAKIQLLASSRAESQRMAEMLTATTDSSGFYRLTDVPPGDYVIGVALQRTMEREDEPAYPRTFYPGVSEASRAKTVTVGEGTRVALDPFEVPAPRQRRQIEGVVVWPDGRPVAGAFISLRDGESTWMQVAVGIQTDADGRFKFPVNEGLSYIAGAHYNLPDGPNHKQVHGTVRFVAAAQTRPLRVVLNQSVR